MISKYLLFAAGILEAFFSGNADAMAVANFLTQLGLSLTGSGGTIPAFTVGGYEIGPIPVVKK